MVDWQANLEVALGVVVLGGGLLLAAVAAIAWNRLREMRAAFVGIGFLMLAAKGAFLTYSAWTTPRAEWILPMAITDSVILLAFYGALRAPRR